MKVLVTGGGGFVGQWLARALLERGDDVVLAGLGDRSRSPEILQPREWDAVRWIPMDMRRDVDVCAAVDATRPDLVVHLAGISFIPAASSAPTEAYDVNFLGAVRLLNELARRLAAGELEPTVLVVGSATQYGRHDLSSMPLTESAEQRPSTVYAATKGAQEIVARQVFRATGLRVICTRSFNHSGAGQDTSFLLPTLVKKAKEIAAGRARPVVTLGNDTVRDYLHVTDVVRAYLMLAERGESGEAYNVCSGSGVSARDLADDVLQQAGTSADISTDPALVRPTDIPVLVGSPERLMRTTGWTVARTRGDIIDDLLNAQTH
jgi:GDP-4-dehydro-6-deoxy-D-mannose reductase